MEIEELTTKNRSFVMEYLQDPEMIAAASEARFQRMTIAILCMIAVVLNTPIPAYFILFTSLLAVVFSSKAEIIGLFYTEILKRILQRDLFGFAHIFPGSFLLDDETNRFIYYIYIVLQSIGIILYHLGTMWWVVPVAIVAAGTTLAATTGICGMAFLYALTKEWRQANNAKQ